MLRVRRPAKKTDTLNIYCKTAGCDSYWDFYEIVSR